MTLGASGLQALKSILAANRRGERRGVTSVCSANPFVLDAAAAGAARRGSLLCIESTASQVNQEGGYTGVTPADFAAGVRAAAAAAGVPDDRLVLGGDHLGPYPWRDRPAATAMERATGLVRDCVAAGYQKLHLDASMRCADDPGGPGGPLADQTAMARTVQLCKTAEDARADARARAAGVRDRDGGPDARRRTRGRRRAGDDSGRRPRAHAGARALGLRRRGPRGRLGARRRRGRATRRRVRRRDRRRATTRPPPPASSRREAGGPWYSRRTRRTTRRRRHSGSWSATGSPSSRWAPG